MDLKNIAQRTPGFAGADLANVVNEAALLAARKNKDWDPNSPLYGFAVNAANPNRILCYSLFGEIYASEDAGDSWQKVKREFGEIRAIAWCPN